MVRPSATATPINPLMCPRDPGMACAIVAHRGTADNCDEFAAVKYFCVLQMNPGENICLWGLPDGRHHSLMIGDTSNPAAVEAVVVDPWSAKGFAVCMTTGSTRVQDSRIKRGRPYCVGVTAYRHGADRNASMSRRFGACDPPNSTTRLTFVAI
jgi:hypothetical protein